MKLFDEETFCEKYEYGEVRAMVRHAAQWQAEQDEAKMRGLVEALKHILCLASMGTGGGGFPLGTTSEERLVWITKQTEEALADIGETE